MINRAMQRFSYDRRNAMSLVALAVFMVHGIASIPFADAGDGRNQLPKKQHKDSDAPFLAPAEAVSKMAIPDGFEVSVFAAEPDIAEPIAFCLMIVAGYGLWKILIIKLVKNILTTR